MPLHAAYTGCTHQLPEGVLSSPWAGASGAHQMLHLMVLTVLAGAQVSNWHFHGWPTSKLYQAELGIEINAQDAAHLAASQL